MPRKIIDPHIIRCGKSEWDFVSKRHHDNEDLGFNVRPPTSWMPYIQLLDKNGDPWKEGSRHAWLVYPVLKAGPRLSLHRKLLAPLTLTEMPFGPKRLRWVFRGGSVLFRLRSYEVKLDIPDVPEGWHWDVLATPERNP